MSSYYLPDEVHFEEESGRLDFRHPIILFMISILMHEINTTLQALGLHGVLEPAALGLMKTRT